MTSADTQDTPDFYLRPMEPTEWGAVARLIHDSTNAWYQQRGHPAIFPHGPQSTRLFCEVYEALDPGCCLVAEDSHTGILAGSCFYHPRSTHMALGIMNVHPGRMGQGVARQLLTFITNLADQDDRPTRLVSSSSNLDSFSLYNRAGFRPHTVYQDMLVSVPASGPIGPPPEHASRVRPATDGDLDAIVELEYRITGLRRRKDYCYFLDNALGIWHTSVFEDDSHGEITGVMTSVRHPASNMIGPGVMRDQATAVALIYAELLQHRDNTCLVLVPTHAELVVADLYRRGARNCELHLAQVRGEFPPACGIVIPTFMPETG